MRWLTLKFLLVRVIERWGNLKEYFWNFLPKQKELKRYVRDTKRYNNIVERLNLALVVFLVIPFYISARKAFDFAFAKFEAMFCGRCIISSNKSSIQSQGSRICSVFTF